MERMFRYPTVCVVQVEVNGENEHPLFTWLKSHLPAPSDNLVRCNIVHTLLNSWFIIFLRILVADEI